MVGGRISHQIWRAGAVGVLILPVEECLRMAGIPYRKFRPRLKGGAEVMDSQTPGSDAGLEWE